MFNVLTSFTGLFCLSLFWFFFVHSKASADDRTLEKLTLLGSGLFAQDSLVVADLTGRVVFERNGDKQLRPASILKLFTVFHALSSLGADYRFPTEIHVAAKDVLIRGYGDPSFTSREIERMVAATVPLLRMKGYEAIGSLSIDEGFFAALSIPGVGTSENPFDVLNGAVVVNYNTIFVERKNEEILSAEEETPITSFAIEMAHKYLRKKKDRINISKDPADTTAYAADLIATFYDMKGLKVRSKGKASAGVRSNFKPLYTHYSEKTLKDIVIDLLRFSNNFTANQLLLVIGARKFGSPATLEKGRQAMQGFLRTKGYDDVNIVEGSGIAPDNSLSCKAMIRLLTAPEWLPYRNLLHKDIKSGTLSVSMSYAGYINDRAFCLILNQPGKTTYSRRQKLLTDLNKILSD